MAWARFGDTSANHPTVLAVLEHEDADDRIVNELFGFVARCSTQSAAHLTDYVINRGTAIALAGSMARADALLRLAMWAGYMVEEEGVVDGRTVKLYRIVEDEEFIHLRTREEIEWERQRKRDNSNPELIVPVRLRDGDGCRYCGCVVRWGDQKSPQGATYDHRKPRRRAETPEDVVVACRACNSGRKDNPNADLDYPLLPPPTRARFAVSTVQWLREHDYVRRLGIEVPEPTEALRPGAHAGDGYFRPAPRPRDLSKPGQGTTTAASDRTSGSRTNEGDGTTGPTAGNGTSGQHNPGDGTTGPTAGNGTSGQHNPGDGTSGRDGDSAGIEQDWPILTNPDQSPDSGIRKSRDGTGRVGKGRGGKGRSPASPPAPMPTKRSRPRRRKNR
ncbi:hypothetical protein [Sinomonas sp. ASV322]|uniref:HNH endonuclease n=1 Tax=Sinomonas sp. ASV322 TaxID=3041920 RepID=UPI0027DE45A6|nr:hypothetical protein [Sinomonas sp. ASV322]MDQ4502168.1 hypothetical protein [Sinomonas sp. ASV322]